MSDRDVQNRFFETCWKTEIKHIADEGAGRSGAETAFVDWHKAVVEAAWFRTALTNARVAVAAQDDALRYVWVFKPFGRLTAEELLGRTDDELLPAEIAAQITALKRGVMSRKQGARGIFAVPTEQDDLVLDLRCEPVLDTAGETVGVLNLAIDLTKEATEQRRLAASRNKAEAALLAKNQAIARASHDLRQPFQAMRMLHEVLRQQPLDTRAAMIVDKIGEAMRSGEALLSSLLDYSVMDSRLQVVRLEDYALQDLFDCLTVEAGAMAAEKGLDFRMVPTSAWVTSDKVLLARLVRNLLVNAVRYTRRGRVLLGCRRRGDEVEIQVCDTGIGIPADQQNLIFEDFYRTDAAASEAGGLGLGLAGVSRISRMLAHPVTVCSQPDRGSMFCVRVPVAQS